ncbi:MAG: adenosine monophosphate-protein transferase [Candidatus Micrarchaeota archaeon]|nr:MAG: adenosine monophosphate-protein transferase [Candidatus Micrarchaeota archaeon]
MADIEIVDVKKEKDEQVILGHAAFIKTVEDLYEAVYSSVPGVQFGIAFSEASGDRLIRTEGNNKELISKAADLLMKLSAGHTFAIFFKNAYPINILNSVKALPEVSRIYCATGNPLKVVILKDQQGNSVIGVIDGMSPLGVEDESKKKERKDLIRKLGYKL